MLLDLDIEDEKTKNKIEHKYLYDKICEIERKLDRIVKWQEENQCQQN
jgi:hypothetical protein